jgi:type II secretory pathway pseudopilin PulG
MRKRGLTLPELLAIVAVVTILVALLVPGLHDGRRGNRGTGCASNLRQLYQLGTIYASTHQGRWPEAKGEDLWLSFTRSTPPLLELDARRVLACPLRGEELEPGQTDYEGPLQPASTLKPGDVLGGDKSGNHGEGDGGNVLHRDGSLTEARPD